MLANAIVWVINAVISGYCISIIGPKYWKKRSGPPRDLLTLFICFVGANLASAANALLREMQGGIQYGYAIALLFLGTGSVALLHFSIEVFYHDEVTTGVKYAQIFFSSIVLIICASGAIYIISAQQNATYVLALEILLAVSLHIVIAIKAGRLMNRIADPVYRNAIKYISIYCICMVGMFMCYIIDSMVSVALQNPALEGETPFSFIGTVTYTVSIVLSYIGFVKGMREH